MTETLKLRRMANESFFETLASAVEGLAARAYFARVEFVDSNWTQAVFERGHIAYETTQTYDWPLRNWRGMPTKAWFHASIYRTHTGRYEVNAYVL